MKYSIRLIPAAILVLALAACSKSGNDEKTEAAASEPAATPAVLATVNGTKIPGALLEFIIAEQLPPGMQADEATRTKVREHLIQREALLQEARKAGTDKEEKVKTRMEFARDDQLLNAYIKEWLEKNPVTDEQLKADYDKKIEEIGSTEYKARHILVETEEAARELIGKLDKGAKFAALAKDSKDPGSKDHGGELDWARPVAFAPEFGAALKTLEKGKYTAEPVKTTFGYHVILLDDTRPASNPSLDDVKGQLSQEVQQENLKKHIDEVLAKAKVE
ncbi:MAG: peptidylprolyl isomerase [Candidatus Dactylopiibacterium carminicum]|uniref:peptidylprolyl isomerase n=1 Tax=Candidatus Dactylopiibacterium carminicum TaxID=857335 RepID=A0A272EQE4_9RHOO|nr:peptidyl-prolyl cis-trans isomerase [Candidatus Dactylopiibacterium carminicum]KAF7598558.1 peptidylprolyl isomerase [Candidatus Dactylopiibacterium carminicum]PAS92311.1 MAG: peptidylprolyl isomerase [Candidatus Dactylopiibacterium carminicum]PAS95896.1 MAG: peptidylprolyl isomerase [Candidatus Dactylopiibacterium carminicum]PAS98118.1 MAG: peptidylprolyl isomerase [Candidatus Dactylopiibacterium carminicum]